MQMNQLTTKSQEAVRSALSGAARHGNPELVPEHLLQAIVEQDGGVGGPLVQLAGADPKKLAQDLRAGTEKLPRVSGGNEPGLGRRVLALMQRAEDEAKALKDDFVSVEHFVAFVS